MTSSIEVELREIQNHGQSARAEGGDWKQAHTELVRLAADQARLDWEVGAWLLCAARAETPRRLGYSGIAEYAHRLFGFDAHFTNEKLRVAQTLEALPELTSAFREGELKWSAVRELTRVATPATEAQWVAAARGRVAREVERLVSGHRPGDHPDDPTDPTIVQHVLRFDVRAETKASVREALAKLRREAGGRLDDDAALLLMARQVLGGPKDTGRASYQIAITQCDGCRRTHLQASGEPIEVGLEVLEMAECDAQQLGAVPASAQAQAATAESAEQSHVELSSTVERAVQDVPPAVRRLVVRRDQGSCQVPGCSHAHFVDLHHIEPRADGGDHDPDALILLCGAHHRAVHRGELSISGRVSTGVRFCHGDGSEYGGRVVSEVAEARTKVFQALRGLGFRETHVKAALERVREGKTAASGFEPLFRQALSVLVP